MAEKEVTPLTTPPPSAGDFELTPAGQYLARCYKMVDLGTQTSVSPKFGTQVARKILLYWEILKDMKGSDVFMADGEHVFSISKEYTWSLNKKANLRKDLESWRGEPFTEKDTQEFVITNLLDKYCLLQVVHKPSANGERTYANVGAIMSADQEQGNLGFNEMSSFSIADPNMTMFEQFPQWLQDKIRAAKEWNVKQVDGEITPEGDIKIEDIKDADPISNDEIKKLPF